MILFPYKPGSNSAKDLAGALGIKRISHKNSRFRGSAEKKVINWGASELPPEVLKCDVINKPEAVAIASNKLSFFRAMEVTDGGLYAQHQKTGDVLNLSFDHQSFPNKVVGGVDNVRGEWVITEVIPPSQGGGRVPKFYTTIEGARKASVLNKVVIVCRTVLTGHSGKGIVLAEDHDQLVPAPLYVVYKPKKQEYRVHVMFGEVVDVQRKARRKDVPDDQVNWRIRNHDNGFIFARGEALGDVPQDVLDQSVKAVVKCGLDFGAVDVIFSDSEQLAYVLEVNTAPGLSGATLDGYVARFKGI